MTTEERIIKIEKTVNDIDDRTGCILFFVVVALVLFVTWATDAAGLKSALIPQSVSHAEEAQK